MESWSVPCSAPGKGSDTLRVTLSIRNTGLAPWGCRCSTETPGASGKFPQPGCQVHRHSPAVGPLWRGWAGVCFSSPGDCGTSAQPPLPLCSRHSVCLSVHLWFWPSAGLCRDTGRWLQPQVATGLVFRRPGWLGGVCCPEWPSNHQTRSAAGGWGASAAGVCCGRQ